MRDLESVFAQVEDPRMERTKLHCLRDIIILAICGAEGWVEIEEFGAQRMMVQPEDARMKGACCAPLAYQCGSDVIW